MRELLFNLGVGDSASGLGVAQSLVHGVKKADFFLHVVPSRVGGEVLDGFDNLVFDGHGASLDRNGVVLQARASSG